MSVLNKKGKRLSRTGAPILGAAFIKANPDEAKEIERKYIGFNSPRFSTFENKAKADDLKVFINIGKELGLYRTTLDPQKLVLP